MSERNGDKARFGRERKHKILQRSRTRQLRKAQENISTRKTSPVPDKSTIV